MASPLNLKRPEPPEGISGYRELDNRSYPPCFKSQLPANWVLEEYPLQSSKGRWIAVKGPLNQKVRRLTALDIFLIEKSEEPRTQSLEAFSVYTRRQEISANARLLSDDERTVAGVRGYESKISTPRTFAGPDGPVEYNLIKLIFIMLTETGFLQVIYEAPEEDFETYAEVYATFLDSLSLTG